MPCFITICTPAFNRGYILERLFNSLKRQTDFDFEWLIIDDGSTDNTEEIVNSKFLKTQEFPVRYYKKDNGGKHTAINKALDLACGKMFFIVDSDDYLVDDAIETIKKWEYQIDGKTGFAGISGNRGYSSSEIIGSTFNGEFIDATALERSKLNISGDKAEIFYTDILKKYRFPEFKGENFLTENVVWNKIAYDGYKLRWFNKIIYITEYLEDGLTAKYESLLSNNPKGYALSVVQDNQYFGFGFNEKNKRYHYYYSMVKKYISLGEAAANLHISRCRLWILELFFGFKSKISHILKRNL
ncbi:MAG: glycosyltransferase family 2 protein [Ruminococcus sp.]|nr:glycosyltransferase family 2 protein [Ruminococcus sp.]